MWDVIKHLQTTGNSMHFNKHSNTIKQIFFNKNFMHSKYSMM